MADKPNVPDPAWSEMAAKLDKVQHSLDLIRLDVDTLRRRQSAALGEGMALTWLADDTPLYVNTPDMGSPANLLNGGLYEEDNLTVLLSFLTPDSIVLDVGANLGLFTLAFAPRLRQGRIHAFEPHPKLFGLMQSSLYLNGHLEGSPGQAKVVCHPFGLGATLSMGQFHTPANHAGGTMHLDNPQPQQVSFQAPIQRADDVLGPDTIAHMIKIDVEGHEWAVLQGMAGLLARSCDVVVLFEKLGAQMGHEAKLVQLLTPMGFELFLVEPGATLRPIRPEDLANVQGYILATRPHIHKGQLNRAQFCIWPANLHSPRPFTHPGKLLHVTGAQGDLLFHGPYWRLPKGVWRVSLAGEIEGEITLSLSTHFGHDVASEALTKANRSAQFVVPHDLLHFECIARATTHKVALTLSHILFERVG